MKNYEKLLIVMLVITVITSILSVSVCAEEQTYRINCAQSIIVTDIETNTTVANGQLQKNVLYKVKGKNYDYGQVVYNGDFQTSSEDNPLIIYTSDINLYEFSFYTSPSTGRYTTWYIMLKEKQCDGSTCPATDINMDNVCDDCGMTFAVLRSYPDPEGWPSNIPSPPAQYDSFTILTENGNTWLYMANGGLSTICISDPDTSGNRTLVFYLNGTYPTSNLQRYRLDGDEWVYNSVGSLTSFSFDETLDFTYTTVDIIDAKGDVVFPLPLWAEIQTIAQGEVTQTSAEVHSVMMTLTLCGVGLIALLVCLTLFGKRSLIFRKY